MNKKGFTLVELLATLAVLSIILLIGTVSVSKVIKKSKTDSYNTQIASFLESTKVWAMDHTNLLPSEGFYISVTYDDLIRTGYTSDNIENSLTNSTFDKNMKFYVNNVSGNYTYTVDPVGSKKSGATISSASNKDTHRGMVYLDPTDLGKECTTSNSVSTTGTKKGCMKWYIYDDSGDTFKLLLDHNTTAMIAWNSSGTNSSGMKEVLTSLNSDTSSWIKNLNARLITADEIAHITGADTALDWDSSKSHADVPVIGTSISYYYFDGVDGTNATWQKQVVNTPGGSKYSWLFDNTAGCRAYGCQNEMTGNLGLWTSTAIEGDATRVWTVDFDGHLARTIASANNSNGVRPVITVKKSDLI